MKPWASVTEVIRGAKKGHLRTGAEAPAALSGLTDDWSCKGSGSQPSGEWEHPEEKEK